MKKGFSFTNFVKEVKAFREIVNEFRNLYPELSSIFSFFKPERNITVDDIKKAISFTVNKIMNDPYIIVGVRKDDPPELVDAVYRVKAKFYHPDNKETGDKEKFIRLNEAYKKIKNAG